MTGRDPKHALVPLDRGSAAKSHFPQRLAVFGSTGSVGVSTLDLVASDPERYRVEALVAGRNVRLLVEQAGRFRPRLLGVADPAAYAELLHEVRAAGLDCVCVTGDAELADFAASSEVDTVVAAIVGSAGLRSTLHAAEAGKRLLLANKESIVAAGALLTDRVRQSGALVIPVDSEHSAIFQLLQGEERRDLRSVILTASGGPFRKTPIDELASVTPAQAVKHPNWSMGAKISVDSASMMNKALEVIEALWLFGLETSQVEVLVHPQSIVHSLVKFSDGTQLAQLSRPDMKGPIGYALGYPSGRFAGSTADLDLTRVERLEFEPLDEARFPAVRLAKECVDAGGARSAVFTIANECAVELFLAGSIRFTEIVPSVERAVSTFGENGVETVDEVLALEQAVRQYYRSASCC